MTDQFAPENCLDYDETCSGEVRYREPLSGTGKSYRRCDKHWAERLDRQQKIMAAYPFSQPEDFSPLDAGESWDDD